MRKRISLNDLPSYHEAVHAMLAGSSLPQRTKNEAEIIREYDVEKWGALRLEAERSGRGFGFATVDQLQMGSLDHCVSVRGDVLNWEEQAAATRRFRQLVGHELRALMPASALVEFGAGYGGMFFPAARAVRKSRPELIALEFTRSGRELLTRISNAEGQRVTVGACDLGARVITPVAIPAEALLFTCFSAHYVPVLTQDLIRSLCALRPKAVVHFEPMVHPELQSTVLGLLRRRYLESNDYNRNLLEVLEQAERAGRIRIDSVEANWFGLNPLLPASRVIWSPT